MNINDAAMTLHHANAILNAMESLAFNDDEGESDQTLVDIRLLCRTTRQELDKVITYLDAL